MTPPGVGGAPASGGEPSWSLVARSEGAEATRSLAARLATVCRSGDVVLLVGGLGAGKTTFAQGFARGLGVTGPVTSPTFTLVRQYPCRDSSVATLLHADVYRLDSLAEVADLGIAELLEDDAVALVEWGDAAAPVLGDSALTVTLELGSPSGPPDPSVAPIGGDEVRVLTVSGRGRAWETRAHEVASAIGAEPESDGTERERR